MKLSIKFHLSISVASIAAATLLLACQPKAALAQGEATADVAPPATNATNPAEPNPSAEEASAAPSVNAENAADASPPISAEPNEPTEDEKAEAKEHYKLGKELFADEDFEGATREFKEAYRLSNNNLLLYNLGFTFDKLGKSELALFYYEKFFWTQAEKGNQNGEVTKRIRALRQETRGQAALAEEKIWEAKAGEGSQAGSFLHTEIEEFPPGKPADITAVAPAWRNWRVKLFYRGAGASNFTSVEMRRRYNELVGRIPAADTASTDTMQYYIEVRDREGELVESSGNAASPHLVFVEPEAKAIFYPDWDDRSDLSSDSDALLASLQPKEVDRPRFKVAKWTATGAAVGLLALSLTFHAVAENAAQKIEREALLSSDEQCPEGPPCRSFSNRQQQLERRGDSFQSASRISLGLGIASAATAGALWAWELTHKTESSERRPTAAPVFSKNYVGAAAQWSF